jgi:hypothetical protein
MHHFIQLLYKNIIFTYRIFIENYLFSIVVQNKFFYLKVNVIEVFKCLYF